MREQNTWSEGLIVWTVASVCLLTLGWYARQFTFKRPTMGSGALVSKPKVTVREVSDGLVNPPRKYVGHVEAVQSVAIQARVSGYLKAIAFTEGSIVKEGDLLFAIDDEEYAARVQQRKAEIGKADAVLDRAQRVLKRLEASEARSVSQMDLDHARTEVALAKATLQEATANLALAEIDLKHTHVYAPFTGKIGKKRVSKGDYVTPLSGTLADVVQVDPIRVVFSVTDRDCIAFKTGPDRDEKRERIQARILLPDGTEYAQKGVWEFVDNRMSVSTATLPIWVNLKNDAGLLIPNTYVTVLLEGTATRHTPVVDLASITHNVQGAYVYVVNASNTVEMCRVKLGTATESLVAIESGLKVGDRVIVEGAQSVRPGTQVEIVAP